MSATSRADLDAGNDVSTEWGGDIFLALIFQVMRFGFLRISPER